MASHALDNISLIESSMNKRIEGKKLSTTDLVKTTNMVLRTTGICAVHMHLWSHFWSARSLFHQSRWSRTNICISGVPTAQKKVGNSNCYTSILAGYFLIVLIFLVCLLFIERGLHNSINKGKIYLNINGSEQPHFIMLVLKKNVISKEVIQG